MTRGCSRQTRMFRLKSILVLFVLLGAFLPSSLSSAPSSVGPGIDLIILIDQSDSMTFGVPTEPGKPNLPATDPDKRRVYTAQYLIDYLSFDNRYVNPHRMNRVVVIGFGTSPDRALGSTQPVSVTHVMVPLTPVKTEAEVDTARRQVKAEHLGETSFLSAFKLVRQLFPPSMDHEVTSGLRRRVIVVITDGGPYDGGPVDYDEYFAKLGDFYKTELGSTYYPVYVIGIDKENVYWSRVQHLWEDNVTGKGNAIRVGTVDEINREVVERICPFLNPTGRGTECRLQELGDHFVPPYARSVSFSFFKYDSKAQVTLFRPKSSGQSDGTEVLTSPSWDADVSDYKTTPRDQFYVIDAPTPGCWKSERVGTGKVDVFIQIVFNDLLMTKPASAHPVIAPLEFEFSLRDTKGNPIDELKGFPLSIHAELDGPNGKSQPVTIQKIQPGLYATTQGVLPTSTGIYTLTLAGTTILSALERCLPAGGTYSVFTQTFQVPVFAPKVVVSAPVSPYHHYLPLKGIAVQFTDERGNLLMTPAASHLSPELILESPTGERQPLGSVKRDGNGCRSDDPLLLPLCGVYTVTTVLRDPGGTQVYQGYAKLEVVDNIELIRPGLNYPVYAPLRFAEIELRDKANQPVHPDPNYPLRIEAKMIWPDGESELVELVPTASPGRYRAPAHWALTTVAPHILEITGYTSLLPGLPEQPVFISRKTINVSGNLPFYIVTAPDERSQNPEYPLRRWFLPPLPFEFAYEPQLVRVELWYGNRPAQAKDFFVGDYSDLFHVTIVDETSRVIVNQLPLRDSVGDGSVFSAELAELKAPGTYTATVSLVGRVRGGVTTQGAWPDATIRFQRRDPVIYLVTWAVLTLALLAATLYFGGGWALNAILLPKAKGKLVTETTGLEPQKVGPLPGGVELDITRKQRHHFRLKKQQIDARLELTRIEIRRAEPQKRRGTRGQEEEEQGVEIRAYDDKGIKVADGRVYKSRSKLTVRQRTSDGKSYQFRYED